MTSLALATDQPAHPISALALVETVTAVQVFSENGLDNIVERIEHEARTTVLDISTPKGRKEIASLAYKIAQSKTAIDKLGKDLVSGWKEQAKKVDVERARARDRLEALQEEIRRPLTEWENREKQRVADHEANLVTIANLGNHAAANWQTMPVEVMNARLNQILTAKTDWQEFSVRAKLATDAAADAIAAAIVKRQAYDSEQAELARLRKEEEERKQREHEEKIARAAAEQARLFAEEEAQKIAEAEAARVAAERAKAEVERQRIQREKEAAEARALKAEQDKKDAVAKAESDRVAAEATAQREKAEADARAAQAEKDRIAAAERAKEDARVAAEKAAADKKAAEEAATKRERNRIAAENTARADLKAKREADEAHRQKVEQEAVAALIGELQKAGIEGEEAELLAGHFVSAVKIGKIPHITISY